jgi:hypothetical protein
MLDKIKAYALAKDSALRQNMAERAYASRGRQISAIEEDLARRMQGLTPDYKGVAANVAQNIGEKPVDIETLLRRYRQPENVYQGTGSADMQSLLTRAAQESGQGPLGRWQSALAGETGDDRVIQAVTYGGGLTAAGQGLAALTEFIQGGERNQVAREVSPLS